VYADEFSIYSGNANRTLARKICRYLKTRMGDVEVFQFANENIFVRVLENVREQDVFLVQPTCRPVNQSIMELLIMIDAFKRASAGRITAVMPYYSYGRSDKKDQPRVPITARLVADMLTVAGADRVLTMDLHQGQIQGFFSIPVDELTAVDILARYIADKHLDDMVIVSELGFAKKARNFAEKLGAPLAIVEKRRVGNEDKTELMNIIGEVDGKNAVIIDDEIDTAGSLMEAVYALVDHGAKQIYSCATHGVFSGTALDRIHAAPIDEVIVTDTIPLPAAADVSKITTLSIAPLFGEAIRRIHRGESVGALFSSEVQLVEEMTFWDEGAPEEEGGDAARDTAAQSHLPPVSGSVPVPVDL
jgi:ribose-phosphate pyrophosphokinase